MKAIEYDAFWSYTHEDNDRSDGRVLGLATALKDEFAVTTADELELFLDRTSLKWGDVWRERIDRALGSAPFFIAIVTPKFVRSEECRKELIAFSGEAKSRGFDRLLLPILYIDVPGLSEDSDDEVLALIARTQFVDWTKLRLLDPKDPKVLQAINELALRVRDLQDEVSVLTLKAETKTPDESVEALKANIDAISERLETWMDAVDFDKVAGRHWRAVRDERLARVQRLRKSHAPKTGIVATFMQLGSELLPIAQDRLAKAKSYSSLTIELDPYVTAALRLAQEHPEYSALLDPLRDGVNEANLNINPPSGQQQTFGLPAGVAERNKHLADADHALVSSYSYVGEANQLVMQWRRRLLELDESLPVTEATDWQSAKTVGRAKLIRKA